MSKRIRAGLERCVYCGGGEVAVDRDHMPPIGVFDKRLRPDKLVFPACKACHNGTRLEDQALAFLSRLLPDEGLKVEEEEFLNSLQGLMNNCPGLLFELYPSASQKRRTKLFEERTGLAAEAMNARGPILNALMERFGARMGLALHFHQTGRIVPPNGRIYVRWYPNYDIVDGKLPQSLPPLIGELQTLREGQRHVEGQFSFAGAATPEGHSSAHLCTFRFSFAVLAFVRERPDASIGSGDLSVIAPGFLRKQPALPLRIDRRSSFLVMGERVGHALFARPRHET